MRNRRLPSHVRKKEIMEAAAKVFLKKGFGQTTMEDVILGTSMSKGGVYHYYTNTIDILHDLMLAGNAYRMEIIRESMKAKTACDDLDFMAKEIVEKMLDENKYMPIYATFLMESKRNPKLKELYETLQKETRKELFVLGESLSLDRQVVKRATSDFIMHWINSFILGANLLEARDCFVENREAIIRMVRLFLEEGKNDNKKEGIK